MRITAQGLGDAGPLLPALSDAYLACTRAKHDSACSLLQSGGGGRSAGEVY